MDNTITSAMISGRPSAMFKAASISQKVSAADSSSTNTLQVKLGKNSVVMGTLMSILLLSSSQTRGVTEILRVAPASFSLDA